VKNSIGSLDQKMYNGPKLYSSKLNPIERLLFFDALLMLAKGLTLRKEFRSKIRDKCRIIGLFDDYLGLIALSFLESLIFEKQNDTRGLTAVL